MTIYGKRSLITHSPPGNCPWFLSHDVTLLILLCDLRRWHELEFEGLGGQSPSHPEALFFFWLFRAAQAAYGGSQARGRIGAAAVGLHRIQAVSVTYTTAHGNAGSPIHRARPRIDSASSWILVRFIAAVPQWGLPPLGAFYKRTAAGSLSVKWFNIRLSFFS